LNNDVGGNGSEESAEGRGGKKNGHIENKGQRGRKCRTKWRLKDNSKKRCQDPEPGKLLDRKKKGEGHPKEEKGGDWLGNGGEENHPRSKLLAKKKETQTSKKTLLQKKFSKDSPERRLKRETSANNQGSSFRTRK